MADQDRHDILTATEWAQAYTVGGKIDREWALETIFTGDAINDLQPLLMDYLYEPDRRDDLAPNIAELLADIVRDTYATQVQDLLDEEAAEVDCWKFWRRPCHKARRIEELLDDPRHEEPTGR